MNLGRGWKTEVLFNTKTAINQFCLCDASNQLTAVSMPTGMSSRACTLRLLNLYNGDAENLGAINNVRSIGVKYSEFKDIIGLKMVDDRGADVLDLDLGTGAG